ncbi:DNA polymerase III subunit beta [Candidatus Woesebacteria bacterium RBG_13_34_9]|uniref:Beta sliding clamp n=1 Tax=Candidatus Woesebacteria bacterium RBG_13_34_9 TaxID=1802477 RepID=A0A1F7X3X0_9BACT|nr:MAG: DNA polymerase III subunit beta [Candidatus Woesebacteria bacterium RBG_13_34_9]
MKVQLPVLANVYLKANNNRLTMSATNLEMSVSIGMGGKITEGGEITIPVRIINDIVNNLPLGQIQLESEKESLKIKTQDFESYVLGMNPSDFPIIPYNIGSNEIKLPSKDLLSAFNLVLFSVSNDETRPTLTGVLMIIKENELVLVATDGFRLSQKKLKLKGLKDEVKIIVPKNVLSEITRLVSKEEMLSFSYKKTDKQIVFGMPNIIVASRLIEGEFPDFERIIPKETKIKISLDREEFLRSVKLASVFAKDAANVIKLKVNKDNIEVSAESARSGSQKAKVEAKVVNEDNTKDFVIAYNCRFIEDLLNSMESDDLLMEFSDANAPGLFLNEKDQNFMHIIMPVRIQD